MSRGIEKSLARNIWVTSQHSVAFCARPGRLRLYATQTLPLYYT